jgi:hypothetical protein
MIETPLPEGSSHARRHAIETAAAGGELALVDLGPGAVIVGALAAGD